MNHLQKEIDRKIEMAFHRYDGDLARIKFELKDINPLYIDKVCTKLGRRLGRVVGAKVLDYIIENLTFGYEFRTKNLKKIMAEFISKSTSFVSDCCGAKVELTMDNGVRLCTCSQCSSFCDVHRMSESAIAKQKLAFLEQLRVEDESLANNVAKLGYTLKNGIETEETDRVVETHDGRKVVVSIPQELKTAIGKITPMTQEKLRQQLLKSITTEPAQDMTNGQQKA